MENLGENMSLMNDTDFVRPAVYCVLFVMVLKMHFDSMTRNDMKYVHFIRMQPGIPHPCV